MRALVLAKRHCRLKLWRHLDRRVLVVEVLRQYEAITSSHFGHCSGRLVHGAASDDVAADAKE